jgi:DNA-binding MarR family transcriptional regulator
LRTWGPYSSGNQLNKSTTSWVNPEAIGGLRHPRQISELLNFRLHLLFASSGAPVIRLLEGRYGVSRREWRLLAALAEHGPLSPSEVAAVMQLDRPRTSRAVGVLAGKGLLLREERSGDARRARLDLTDAGRRLYGAAFPEIAAINTQLVSVLDDAELAALNRALERLQARALEVNACQVQDAKADRRRGGSRRIRPAHHDPA